MNDVKELCDYGRKSKPHNTDNPFKVVLDSGDSLVHFLHAFCSH